MKVSFAQNNNTNIMPSGYIKTQEADDKKYYHDDYILEGIGAKLPNPKRAVYELTTYPKKGLKGSPNSNFYEFLKMGKIPYVVGSAAMIALYCVGVNKYNSGDKLEALKIAKQVGTGVVLYAAGKSLGGKLVKKGVHMTTGIDVDMPYRKIVAQAPEKPGENRDSVDEYHKVFESVDFVNWPILEKFGARHGDCDKYYKKIAKRAGFGEDLNAPGQTMQPRIKSVVTRTYAAKNVVSYLWAALGVALSRQQAVVDFAKNDTFKTLIKNPKQSALKLGSCAKNAVKQLWNGTNKTSGILGKTLMAGTLAATVLGVALSNKDFRAKKHKSVIDPNKPVEEC